MRLLSSSEGVFNTKEKIVVIDHDDIQENVCCGGTFSRGKRGNKDISSAFLFLYLWPRWFE